MFSGVHGRVIWALNLQKEVCIHDKCFTSGLQRCRSKTTGGWKETTLTWELKMDLGYFPVERSKVQQIESDFCSHFPKNGIKSILLKAPQTSLIPLFLLLCKQTPLRHRVMSTSFHNLPFPTKVTKNLPTSIFLIQHSTTLFCGGGFVNRVCCK